MKNFIKENFRNITIIICTIILATALYFGLSYDPLKQCMNTLIKDGELPEYAAKYCTKK